MTIKLNPHTKTEAMLISLIGIWLYYKGELKKDYVPAMEIIKDGFKPTKVYDFFDDLRRNELAEPYGESHGSMRNMLRPTAIGVSTFLNYFKNRLEKRQSSKEKQTLDIEIVMLKKICESLEKLQSLFFSSPRE